MGASPLDGGPHLAVAALADRPHVAERVVAHLVRVRVRVRVRVGARVRVKVRVRVRVRVRFRVTRKAEGSDRWQ